MIHNALPIGDPTLVVNASLFFLLHLEVNLVSVLDFFLLLAPLLHLVRKL